MAQITNRMSNPPQIWITWSPGFTKHSAESNFIFVHRGRHKYKKCNRLLQKHVFWQINPLRITSSWSQGWLDIVTGWQKCNISNCGNHTLQFFQNCDISSFYYYYSSIVTLISSRYNSHSCFRTYSRHMSDRPEKLGIVCLFIAKTYVVHFNWY